MAVEWQLKFSADKWQCVIYEFVPGDKSGPDPWHMKIDPRSSWKKSRSETRSSPEFLQPTPPRVARIVSENKTQFYWG